MEERTLVSLGRYTIRAELERGGFATVYRALDPSLEREVALKILHPQLLADRSFAERFRKEARALAALRHSNIVTVFEVSEADGRLYIAMELAKGPNLAQAIAERGRIPWSETVALLKPVCEALDYAHAQGVVHRDLKPANILLDRERGPLLTDFGFARLMSESTMSMSLSGGILGTPAYIAPEVWELEAAKPSADIYALGCILYEMLTGQVLFAGKTPMQAMRAHDRGPQFPPPSAWPEGVPVQVESVMRQALARQPEARYPSATILWQALNDLETESKAAKDKAERATLAAPWRQEAEAALATGEWSAARMAVGRWLAITPDDPAAQTMRQEIDRRESEARAKVEAEQRAQRQAQEQQQREAERKAAQEADRKAKEEQERQARERLAQREAEEQRQREAERRAQVEQARKEHAEQAAREAERLGQYRLAQAAAEQKAREERERQVRAQQSQPAPAARRTIPAWTWIGGVVALLACVVCAVWIPRQIFHLMPAPAPAPTRAPTKVLELTTPAPAPTRVPTKVLEPTMPAPVRTATRTPIATVTYQFLDTFDSDTNQWPIGDFSSEYGTYNRSISNGKYRWSAKALKGLVAYSDADSITFSDLQLTVEGQLISGSPTAAYGVYFRDDGTNRYLFHINNDSSQTFEVFLRYKGAWTKLIGSTRTSAIKPGAANQLTVRAKGSHLVFYINSVQVGTTDDDQLSGGGVGIAIELFNAGDAAVFEFDNFRVDEP